MSFFGELFDFHAEGKFYESLATLERGFPDEFPQAADPGESDRDFEKRKREARSAIEKWNKQVEEIRERWDATRSWLLATESSLSPKVVGDISRTFSSQLHLAKSVNGDFSQWATWIQETLREAYEVLRAFKGSSSREYPKSLATVKKVDQIAESDLSDAAEAVVAVAKKSVPQLDQVSIYKIVQQGGPDISTLHFVREVVNRAQEATELSYKASLLGDSLEYQRDVIKQLKSAIASLREYDTSIDTAVSAWEAVAQVLERDLLAGKGDVAVLADPLRADPHSREPVTGSYDKTRAGVTFGDVAARVAAITKFTTGTNQGSAANFKEKCGELISQLQQLIA